MHKAESIQENEAYIIFKDFEIQNYSVSTKRPELVLISVVAPERVTNENTNTDIR